MSLPISASATTSGSPVDAASSAAVAKLSRRHRRVRVIAVPDGQRGAHPGSRGGVGVGEVGGPLQQRLSSSPGSAPGASHGQPPLTRSSAPATRPAVAARPARSASASAVAAVSSTVCPRPARASASQQRHRQRVPLAVDALRGGQQVVGVQRGAPPARGDLRTPLSRSACSAANRHASTTTCGIDQRQGGDQMLGAAAQRIGDGSGRPAPRPPWRAGVGGAAAAGPPADARAAGRGRTRNPHGRAPRPGSARRRPRPGSRPGCPDPGGWWRPAA